MNILEYTLRLNDNMSAALVKVSGSIDNVTGNSRNMKREIETVNNVNFNGLYSKLKSMAATVGIGALLGKTLKTGMEQEMRNVSFEVLFGGSDKAKSMIDEISRYAAESPYTKSGLSDSVRTMAGMQVPMDKIVPTMRAIGDITMGNSERFSSMALAFSQMSSNGKLQGQDLLQMINAGFNPLNQISKDTGKSMAELRVEMSKGAISSDMVTNAFIQATSKGGQYYGLIDRINKSAAGQWAVFTETFGEKLISFYDNVLQPILLPALQKINKFLDDPIDTTKRLIGQFTNLHPVLTGIAIAIGGIVVGIATYKGVMLSLVVIQAVVNAIKAATVAYEVVVFAVKNATSLWVATQWLLNVALGLNPVGLVIAGIVALIAVIIAVSLMTTGWGNAWKHTVNGVKLIWATYVEYVKSSFNAMIQGLMIGINKIEEGWYKFKNVVGLGDNGENDKMLAKLNADTNARKNSIVQGYKNTLDLGKQAASEFAAAATSVSFKKGGFGSALSSGTKLVKAKLGISTPSIPGTNNGQGNGTNLSNGGNGSPGSSVGKDTANSISTGGSKTTNVTINLGELVGSVNINRSGFQESARDMGDMVLDELMRALSMAQGQTG